MKNCVVCKQETDQILFCSSSCEQEMHQIWREMEKWINDEHNQILGLSSTEGTEGRSYVLERYAHPHFLRGISNRKPFRIKRTG